MVTAGVPDARGSCSMTLSHQHGLRWKQVHFKTEILNIIAAWKPNCKNSSGKYHMSASHFPEGKRKYSKVPTLSLFY